MALLKRVKGGNYMYSEKHSTSRVKSKLGLWYTRKRKGRTSWKQWTKHKSQRKDILKKKNQSVEMKTSFNISTSKYSPVWVRISDRSLHHCHSTIPLVAYSHWL